MMQPAQPVEYFMEQGAKFLNLPDEYVTQALAIIAETSEEDFSLSSRSRRTKCAAATYITMMLNAKHRNQRDVADAFDTTEVSVRSVYSQMLESYLRLHPEKKDLRLKYKVRTSRALLLKKYFPEKNE
jgi:transcription initiation factor TFIIIB Brf1 subunit/transcription initiation factor TFIIB